MVAIVDKEKCTACGDCVEVCPLEVIKIENNKATISEYCVECGACAGECSFEAISL